MSLNYLIILVFVLLAIYEIVNSYQDRIAPDQKNDNDNLYYKRKYYFFTVAEKRFFEVLQNVINDKYLIFSKVRVVDLLDVPKGVKNPVFYKHFNKIKAKHVDFVICDKDKVAPLLIIELDDSSHYRSDRIRRDEFVNQAFKSAGVPIIHIQNAASYDQNELFQSLSNYLKPVAG